MPEANWWVAVVFIQTATASTFVSAAAGSKGQKAQTCLLLFFGVDHSTLKSWGCSQLPHGEGIRTLCNMFQCFFLPPLTGISVQKSVSAACIQPLKSHFSSRRKTCKGSVPVLYRRTGESGLSLTAGFWGARDASHCLHPREPDVGNTLCL